MQFRPDRLTVPERIGAILSRQTPDRVPFIPFIFGTCAVTVGYPVSAIYDDAEKSFWSQMWSQEMYGYDGSPLYGYASYGGWEFGGDIAMPTGRFEMAPVITRFPVGTEKDVMELKLPDVRKAGCNPIMMEFGHIMHKMGMPVFVQVGEGVFSTATNICGVDKFCRWMLTKPELAHRLLRLSTDLCIANAKLWADTFGVENIFPWIAEPASANQIISPKQFEEFALPYLKELHETMLDMGVKHIFAHICGEHNLNLPYWSQVPMGDPGIVSFGHEVDLEIAAKTFPTDIIAGNIEPQIVQTGTHEDVYEICRAAIEKGKKCPGGYVLMGGCEIPIMAPPYNIYTIRKAVNNFGWYE